jgi:uncharacterized protein DUF6916
MQRRQFIAGCSAALAAAAIEPPQLWTAASANAGAAINRARFEPLVGSEFRLYNDRKFVGLVHLEAIVDGPRAAGLEQFTLRWKGTDAERLPEGIYTLTTAGAASMDLALEPAHSADQSAYRSTFNLLS